MNKARNAYLKRTYGIEEKQYTDQLNRQGSCCGVCARPAWHFATRLAVDHDHHTGEIRGLLCTHCNRRIIGRHRREAGGATLLRRASHYLEGPYTGWFVPKKKKRTKRKVKRG